MGGGEGALSRCRSQAVRGVGEGEARDGLRGGERNVESLAHQWWRAHRRKRSRRSRGQFHRLGTNCWSDRRIEGTGTKLSTRRTKRYPRIPPTTHGLKVITQRSWNRPELRRTIPGVSDLNWERGFKIRKRLDERFQAIYIARV
jgi:hypothetical protein